MILMSQLCLLNNLLKSECKCIISPHRWEIKEHLSLIAQVERLLGLKAMTSIIFSYI